MRLQLGINTCFAVKRWPRPDDWAPLVRDRLGLRLVQHSLDLVDPSAPPQRLESAAGELRAAVAGHGLELHSTFTGLVAYSANLLLAPDAVDREAALAWYRQVIGLTAAVGGRATGGHVGCFSVPDWRDPQRRNELWEGLRRALAELATDARGAGLEYLVVENLAVAREPSTMAMIGELLDDGDASRVPIRLCLDVGHMVVPGTDGTGSRPVRVAADAWPLRADRPAAAVGCRRRSPLALHRADQCRGSHLGRTRDRRARGGRRRGVRAGPGGHPAVRAGRRRGP